jgi:uncharacterized protein
MKPNPVVHFEMPYENHQRLSAFYSSAFGWQMNKLGADMGDYVLAGTTETDDKQMIKTPGTINGGFFPKTAESPQHPSVVIAVDDVREAMKKVTAAGGKVHGEPVEIPGIGQYVSITDTEGNQLSILQPLPMKN